MPALPIAKKRVAIVGGGAAGCSAAYAMSLSPELFEVTLFERAAVLGGMATSTEIGKLLITLNTSGTVVLLHRC
jgi:protoporphyrinogen oxidase